MHDMRVEIRHAEEKDLPAILTIYNHAIRTTNAVYTEQKTTLEERKAWFQQRRQHGFPVFVLNVFEECREKTAAFGTFNQFRPWTGYQYSVEHSLYVGASFRGKGFGRLMLQKLLEEAINMNMHLMVAGIDAENHASIHLHETFGFQSAGILKEAGYKNGQFRSLHFMQKILS